MRIYGKVKITFWDDDRIKKLPDAAKLLALYCLTCEHSNAIGCFRLPLGYIETDLGWDKTKAQAALTELITSGFALYDEASAYLLMPRYLEHNPIENSRVGKMCVGLINAAMRSREIFPALWQALQSQRHRFAFKDADNWNTEWDTLYHTLSGKGGDTVSHTVSHRVTLTVSDTVSSIEPLFPETGGNPELDTVSPTVSDTVSSTLHGLAPPEPDPDPEPEPEYRDDEVARAKPTPVAIIRAFDEAVVQVYGANLARPWPHGEDATIAAQFIAAGASLELCKQVFLRTLHAHQRKGKHPIGSLAYFRTAIPDAVKDREFYQNNPPPEVSHDGHTHGARARPRSGHDAFTDALVEVVHERGGH